MSKDFSSCPVFLSHSSKDKDVAIELKSLLEFGVGKKGVVFCSSVEDSVPSGTDFTKYIRKQLLSRPNDAKKKKLLVIFLLTPSFYSSKWCMSEAGAAWILKLKLFPLLLGVDADAVTPVFFGRQQPKLASHTIINSLRTSILKLTTSNNEANPDDDTNVGPQNARDKNWREKIDDFIKMAKEHEERTKSNSLYLNSTNAIVEHSIEDCAQYISEFYSARMGDGEIWLFNTDLHAFSEMKPFQDLYRSKIFSNEYITKVKMLLRASFLEELRHDESRVLDGIVKQLKWSGFVYSDNEMHDHGHRLVFRVMSSFSNRSVQEDILNYRKSPADPNVPKPAMFDIESIEKSKQNDYDKSDLRLYTSRESFIFYSHGNHVYKSLTYAQQNASKRIAACIHRRLEDEGDITDLRVTITAHENFIPTRTSMKKFISDEHIGKFAMLFSDTDVKRIRSSPVPIEGTTWLPFEVLLWTLNIIPSKIRIADLDWQKVADLYKQCVTDKFETDFKPAIQQQYATNEGKIDWNSVWRKVDKCRYTHRKDDGRTDWKKVWGNVANLDWNELEDIDWEDLCVKEKVPVNDGD